MAHFKWVGFVWIIIQREFMLLVMSNSTKKHILLQILCQHKKWCPVETFFSPTGAQYYSISPFHNMHPATSFTPGKNITPYLSPIKFGAHESSLPTTTTLTQLQSLAMNTPKKRQLNYQLFSIAYWRPLIGTFCAYSLLTWFKSTDRFC